MTTTNLSYSALFTARDAQNIRVFNYWFFAAMVVFAAATLLIDGKFVSGLLGWGLTGLAVALSVMMVRAYVHFLREADELLRKIQLEALAVSFGATVVFMLGYRLCERLGAMKLDVNDPLMVMVGVFAIGQWTAMRRYAAGDEQ